MLNPFFLQGSKSEQSLVQDLINEQLRMYGVEIYYIPRKYITKNTVIKEVIESKFDSAYPLEAYVETYDGYEGQGTILSKFGIQPMTDLTVIISRERYETYITPLIKNQEHIELATRPKEGDLIYFPLGNRLFEIKFVEHEKPFYQLQKTYVYELRCELFQIEDELINTGIDYIDNPSSVDNDGSGDNTYTENRGHYGYIQKLSLVGVGTTATAITGIVNGGVHFVSISNRGYSFTSPPSVAISSSPSGGNTATGIASMIDYIIDLNGIISPKVQRVELINPGYGYTEAPKISFIGGGGSGVAATTIIGDGVIGIITVTNSGSGYVIEPTVTVSSPGIGITAKAKAYINSTGNISLITILNAGLGYTTQPTITISPPSTVGYGTFAFNEVVTGTISSTSGRVKSWNAITKELELSNVNGTFVPGDIVMGGTSGAYYTVKTSIDDDQTDAFEDNAEIELEADGILDFTERNPFGIP